MSQPAIVVLVYAALILLGGVIGYAKAKSKPSLIAGVLFGILIGAAGFLIELGQDLGMQAAAGLASLMLLLFMFRLVKTRKFMPSGMLVLMSAAVLVYLWRQGIPGVSI